MSWIEQRCLTSALPLLISSSLQQLQCQLSVVRTLDNTVRQKDKYIQRSFEVQRGYIYRRIGTDPSSLFSSIGIHQRQRIVNLQSLYSRLTDILQLAGISNITVFKYI